MKNSKLNFDTLSVFLGVVLIVVVTGCNTTSDMVNTGMVVNATHDGEYPSSKMVKILPGNENNAVYQSEISSPTASSFSAGTSTFVLYVEFPSGADAGNNTLSYCLYRSGLAVSEPVIIASKSYKGKPSTIWGIRQGDDTVHLVTKSLFHNVTKDIEFASTPHTTAILRGVQGVCVRTVVKSESSGFAAGSYLLDILWDKTVVRSLSFDVQ
jgi:hypothetical protein